MSVDRSIQRYVGRSLSAALWRDAWLREIRAYDVQVWLEEIARDDKLSKTSLKHLKHFLSGMFNHAAQQDYWDGANANPVKPTSIPDAPSAGETHFYLLEEIKAMLAILPEPAATLVAVAAFTGLRRGEIRGLVWENYTPAMDGQMASLQVTRSIWGRHVGKPKTKKSESPVPVIAPLAKMLNAHRFRCGNPQTGPIFANSFGRPLDIDSFYRRVMKDVFSPPEGERRIEWHGWHAGGGWRPT